MLFVSRDEHGLVADIVDMAVVLGSLILNRNYGLCWISGVCDHSDITHREYTAELNIVLGSHGQNAHELHP